MIDVRAVTKRYTLTRRQKQEAGDGFTGSTIDAVQGLSFACRPGRVFALLGPNGAGKTTMLRMIATMLRPTQGTITVAGYDVAEKPQDVRTHLGSLTGDTGLYDRLTAREFIKYFADLHGLGQQTFNTRCNELFTVLDMHEFAHRRIARLSTGMKQKVSIVRTMIHDPDVLIFDEPTAGLDVVASRNIIQLIRKCRDDGKTVLFSTHRMGEVSLLADDLAIIHKGRLLYAGDFQDFLRTMQAKSLEDEFIRIVEGGQA